MKIRLFSIQGNICDDSYHRPGKSQYIRLNNIDPVLWWCFLCHSMQLHGHEFENIKYKLSIEEI